MQVAQNPSTISGGQAGQPGVVAPPSQQQQQQEASIAQKAASIHQAAAAAAAVAAAAAGLNPGEQASMTQIILDHPLYPLLQMVFQKCELATSSPRDAQTETICSSDSFGDDIRNFIQESRMRNCALTTGAHDIDKFMLKSIEVLRIHLLELEKVHQLCDNFCQRYINCLKGKLPIDLVVDDGSSRDTNSASRNGSNNNNNNNPNNNNQDGSSSNNQNNSSSSNGQNNPNSTQTDQQNNSNQNNSYSNNHHTSSTYQQNNHQTHQDSSNGYGQDSASAAAAYHQAAAYGAAYGGYAAAHYAAAGMPAAHAGYAPGQEHLAPKHDPHQPQQHHLNSHNHQQQQQQQNHHGNPASNHRELTASSGSSSASSIKMEHHNGAGVYGSDASGASAQDRQRLHDDVRSPTGSTGSGEGTECDDDDARGRRQQKKRGIFPKAATNIMRAWLFAHLNHPYPSEDQKKQLAEETGLTILQVNNWFINARRRIVQPMIDQSNRTSGNIMGAGPAYSPDAGMGYMLDGGQPFRSLSGADPTGMGQLASHAAMTSAAMGAYSAASAQHLSQYGRSQQQQAAMLGLSTPPTGPHPMMGHPALPPHEYY